MKSTPIIIKQAALKDWGGSIKDIAGKVGNNSFVRHVGGGALIGAPIMAADQGTMGSPYMSARQRLLDGAKRGAIGGGAAGVAYHIGRKSFNLPPMKEIIKRQLYASGLAQ